MSEKLESIAKVTDIFVKGLGVLQVLGTWEAIREEWIKAPLFGYTAVLNYTAIGVQGYSNPVTFLASHVIGIGGEHEYAGPLSLDFATAANEDNINQRIEAAMAQL